MEDIPGILGYIILNEDNSVISSGGELENAEHIANIVPLLVYLADTLKQGAEPYSRITVIFKDYCYVICISNRKTYVAKKEYHSPTMNTSDGDITVPQYSNA